MRNLESNDTSLSSLAQKPLLSREILKMEFLKNNRFEKMAFLNFGNFFNYMKL